MGDQLRKLRMTRGGLRPELRHGCWGFFFLFDGGSEVELRAPCLLGRLSTACAPPPSPGDHLLMVDWVQVSKEER
jgi:hypothetical protein